MRQRFLLGMVLAAVVVAPAAADPSWQLDASDTTYSYVCGGGDSLVINGSANAVTISGECSLLEINGSDNRVAIEAVASIRIYGNNNDVRYARAVKGKKPAIKKKGASNTVRKAD